MMAHRTKAHSTRPKPFAWNGITYPSKRAAARKLGVHYNTIEYYDKRGYTCDDDLRKPRQCVWNDITYPTVVDAALANDMPPQTMLYRLDQGYTCDDDVPSAGGAKKVIIDDVEYNSIAAAARAYGISRQAMWERLNK